MFKIFHYCSRTLNYTKLLTHMHSYQLSTDFIQLTYSSVQTEIEILKKHSG
jgi:hypothetical protein